MSGIEKSLIFLSTLITFIKIKIKDFYFYNICKGKLSYPISKILDPNSVSPTLTATDSHKLAIVIDDKIIRKLNSNEMKKLCGFPESFIIPDHVNYYDLFGNMATPPVIEALLKLLFS